MYIITIFDKTAGESIIINLESWTAVIDIISAIPLLINDNLSVGVTYERSKKEK